MHGERINAAGLAANQQLGLDGNGAGRDPKPAPDELDLAKLGKHAVAGFGFAVQQSTMQGRRLRRVFHCSNGRHTLRPGERVLRGRRRRFAHDARLIESNKTIQQDH